MVALARAWRRLQLAQQRIHFLACQLAACAHGMVAGHGRHWKNAVDSERRKEQNDQVLRCQRGFECKERAMKRVVFVTVTILGVCLGEAKAEDVSVTCKHTEAMYANYTPKKFDISERRIAVNGKVMEGAKNILINKTYIYFSNFFKNASRVEPLELIRDDYAFDLNSGLMTWSRFVAGSQDPITIFVLSCEKTG